MSIKEKRSVELYWETHEITKISLARNESATVFCQTCCAPTLHLSIPEAASILKLSEFEVFRFLEANQIHSIETGAATWVCGRSLSAFEQDRQIEN